MLVLIAALATAPAQSQVPPRASPSDQIVVEGRNPKETATDYIDKLLPAIGTEAQFGRFEDPICPKAIGLADDLATQVADRVRQVARSTNIPVAAETCTPNLLIIATADKKAMIDTLRKSRPGYLAGVGSDELRRLGNSTRPYVAWQVTDEVAADGMPIGGGDNLPTGSNGGRETGPAARNHDTYVQGDFARLRTTVSPSRIRSTVRPRVLSSVVIVEDRALTNATTRQLADFALVKAMTPTEEREHEPPSSSILGLFNPGVTVESGPQSVTWWDVAFLKSMTNTRSDAFADTQRSEIRDQMIKEINKVRVEQP
jgi:hypothetical protein